MESARPSHGHSRRRLVVLLAVLAGLLLVGVTGALHAEDYPFSGCRVHPGQAENGYFHPLVGAEPSCPDTPSPGGPGVGE
jgi:hypothetical protein